MPTYEERLTAMLDPHKDMTFDEMVAWSGDMIDAVQGIPEVDFDLEVPDDVSPGEGEGPTKLSRVPYEFEKRVLSLHEIPRRLDASIEAARACFERAPDHGIDAVMRDVAAFGAMEVRRELSRQGATLDLHDHTPIEGLSMASDQVQLELHRDVEAIQEEVVRRLKRRKLSDAKRRAAIQTEVERRFNTLAYRYARRAITEAFAIGRASEIRALATPLPPDSRLDLAKRHHRPPLLIDDVVQTTVFDKNRCDECASVDGEVMTFGSDRQKELEPPYYRCLGGDNCRCVQVAILSDGSEVEIVDGEVVEHTELDDTIE